VSDVACGAEDFIIRLIDQGLSADRAMAVAKNVPAFFERNLTREVAELYGEMLEEAGADVVVAVDLGEVDADTPDSVDQPLALPLAPAPTVEFTDAGSHDPRDGSRPVHEVLVSSGGLDPAADAPAPDAGAREFKVYKPRETHVLVRFLPHLIALVTVLLAGSYVYGCTVVMRQASAFSRELPKLGVEIGKLNAQGATVTPAVVAELIHAIGAKVGVSVAAQDIRIAVEHVDWSRLTDGRCHFTKVPDMLARMSARDQDVFWQRARSCQMPNWLLEIRIRTAASWLFASRDIELTRYAQVMEYRSEEQ
jgi:hypothetical protein